MTTLSRFLVVALAVALTLPSRMAAFASTSTGSGGDASTLLHVAAEALGRQDFAAAAKALKSAVESQPDLVPAWFNLAFAYSGLHRNEDAVKAYRKTLELKPDLFEARLNLAILFLEMNQPQAAQEQLSKSLALKPEHARAHLYYGRALTQAGQTGEAENQFREVLRLDPNLAIAYFDLGQVYLSQKRFPEARVAFENSARLDPKLPQPPLGLALACEGLNQPAEAVTHFEQYLAAAPGDLETRFHLAKIYIQLGKNEQALAALQSVYAAKAETPGLAAALGDVNALLKNYPDSEKYYRQALAATPGEPELHRALGQTLLDEQKLSEAENEFRTALKLDPHNREAMKGVASSLYLEKRYAETIPFIQALLRAPGAPAGLYFIVATCFDHLRARPEALEAYDRYLDLSHDQNPDQEWQARQRAKLLRRELRK